MRLSRDLLQNLLAAVAAIVALTMSVAATAQEKRVALVIGNAAYREAPLKNPVNDARAMAAALKRAGFEVLLHENLGRAQFAEAVGQFGDRLSEGATGLFYFAGHGLQVQGRNYLVPVDARITTENRVRLETLDVEAVLDQMQAARTRVSMVILDACRNNPFERRFRSSGAGLAQINAPTGTLIAYATAPGKVAADGEGANGIYTQELLRALIQPGLRVEDVFKQVRVNVMRQTGEAQVPWETSSLTGDFVFVPASAPPAPVATPAPTPAAPPPPTALSETAAFELAFWQSVAGSQNRGDFEAYLERYPNGAFAALARARIAQLTPRTAAANATAPPAPAPSASPQPSPPPPSPPPATTTTPARPAGRPEPPQQQTAMIAPPPPPAAPQKPGYDGRWRGDNGLLSLDGRVENGRFTGSFNCGGATAPISGVVGPDGRIRIITGNFSISGHLPTLDVFVAVGGSASPFVNCRSGQITLGRDGDPPPPQPAAITASPPAASPMIITDFNGRWRGNSGQLGFEGRIENGRLTGAMTCGGNMMPITGQVSAEGAIDARIAQATLSGQLPVMDVHLSITNSASPFLSCTSASITLRRE